MQELIKCGCEKSSFDPSFFMFRDVHGNLIGVIAAHIDDFLHAGTAEFEVRVIQRLCIRFLAGKQKVISSMLATKLHSYLPVF